MPKKPAYPTQRQTHKTTLLRSLPYPTHYPIPSPTPFTSSSPAYSPSYPHKP